MGNSQRRDYDTTPNTQYKWPNWMSLVPDDYPVERLSIPGTHNSLSFYGGFIIQCQSWSLSTQLDAGIRFLDIRCRQVNNELMIYHSKFSQHTSLAATFATIKQFFLNNPSEFIIMRIRDEYKALNSSEEFSVTFMRHMLECDNSMLMFWTKPFLPMVGEARGKIILLRSFKGRIGINFRDLQVADKWHIPTLFALSKKWRKVCKHLQKASSRSDDKLFITFCSGAGWGAYPHIVASSINCKVFNLIASAPEMKNRWGVVVFDYPGPELIKLVILSNF
jgi:1-phosphatidylinositol phosphodiesterase